MLGENIRLGRIAANLDKKSFAKKVGVKVRTVDEGKGCVAEMGDDSS